MPIIGGPIIIAIPQKRDKSPKAFMSLSRPRRSTRTTGISPTYAPEVTPKIAQ